MEKITGILNNCQQALEYFFWKIFQKSLEYNISSVSNYKCDIVLYQHGTCDIDVTFVTLYCCDQSFMASFEFSFLSRWQVRGQGRKLRGQEHKAWPQETGPHPHRLLQPHSLRLRRRCRKPFADGHRAGRRSRIRW